ncbi:MAG: histone deacetylase [Actinomycetes bacterium]
MDAAIIWDEAYAEHETGAHPEGADRIASVVAHLRATDLWPRLAVVKPEPATEDDILLVHTRLHLNTVKRAAAGGGSWLDPDTHVSPRSYEIALLAAGGAIAATRLWRDGLVPFALIRPPGHHATPDRAMGFCLFDNIAVAAARLLAEGCERVAIVDWDVHHGNGTQAAFYDEPRVLFVSLHQWPHYPGSGFFSECGEGAAEGYTVNLPLPSGSTDADYAHAFEAVVEPVVRQFAPRAILVSAGQDIHRDDPLGSMLVTEAGFADMALRCARLARKLCEGRLAFVLEGGYDRDATARSVEAILRAVSDEAAPALTAEGTERAAAAVARARETQAAFWDL